MQVASLERLPRGEQMCALVGTTSAAVEEPSMADVGRNDPCPCGSGKKYKRCHLLVEEAAPAPIGQRARARHQIDERVVSEMLRFGRRHFPDWNPVVEHKSSAATLTRPARGRAMHRPRRRAESC